MDGSIDYAKDHVQSDLDKQLTFCKSVSEDFASRSSFVQLLHQTLKKTEEGNIGGIIEMVQ